jgi:transcriptional regulator GlxA family with amidase domain
VVRYPVEIGNAAEVDDRMTRAILDAIEGNPRLRTQVSEVPSIKMEEQPAGEITLSIQRSALEQRVHMSPRNFARVYAQTRGRTPARAVEAIRLDAARRRLEETMDRIEKIASDCGFSGEEQMRLAFVRGLGIPPRDYRKRFTSTVS